MLWTTSAYFHTTYEKLAGYGKTCLDHVDLATTLMFASHNVCSRRSERTVDRTCGLKHGVERCTLYSGTGAWGSWWQESHVDLTFERCKSVANQ